MTDKPGIETFGVDGEEFRAWAHLTTYAAPHWFVMHHDPATGAGHEHYLGGWPYPWPESLEEAKASAAAHVAALRETGNCQGNIALRLRLNGVVHRGHLDSERTACGLRLPGSIADFRIPGPVYNSSIFNCGRCAQTWR